jgi:hypothetical protein
MLEVAARQMTTEKGDILEHVSVLYKYTVHNKYIAYRDGRVQNMLFILLAHTYLNVIIMADIPSVHTASANTSQHTVQCLFTSAVSSLHQWSA